MKLLVWLKENVNVVSFFIGIGFLVNGQIEVGQDLIKGAGL